MFNVSSSSPPASTVGYAEGFVWYTTGTGNAGGGSFADSITYFNDAKLVRTWSWTGGFPGAANRPETGIRLFQILTDQDVPFTAKFAYITMEGTIVGRGGVADLKMWAGRNSGASSVNRGHLIFDFVDFTEDSGSSNQTHAYLSPSVLVPLVMNGGNIGFYYNFQDASSQSNPINNDTNFAITMRLDGYF